ncbi:MAG: choice-of-anchor U domain-containing protein, partial [Wenzhouxiangellaceae bacterium]
PAATDTLVVNEDSDGVPAAVENLAPNGGDGNNDGIPDGIQDDVASLPAFDGSTFITVVARGGCDTLTQVAALSPATQASPPPADLVFPFGLIGFALPCETALVDVIFHDALTGFSDQYFKFGPSTPGDPATEQWYAFGGATRAGNVWTLALADNAQGDATGDDGLIIDPGGPTLPVLAVPATGHAVLALMALLLLLTASMRLRRDPRFQPTGPQRPHS